MDMIPVTQTKTIWKFITQKFVYQTVQLKWDGSSLEGGWVGGFQLPPLKGKV